MRLSLKVEKGINCKYGTRLAKKDIARSQQRTTGLDKNESEKTRSYKIQSILKSEFFQTLFLRSRFAPNSSKSYKSVILNL